MPQQRISLDPEFPVAGRDVTICYDFDDAGINATLLLVTFLPKDISGDSFNVTRENPCFTITLSKDATQICVQDCGGSSPDYVAPIAPD